MSKMSEGFHKFVNGLNVDQPTKDLLNNYGLFVVWGLIVGVPLLLILSKL